jgi:L-alanine-DL-glutamate epimerase-like enolase superfamily enzyme
MRITELDAIQAVSIRPPIQVRIHADAGPVRLGETNYHTAAVAGYGHHAAAPCLVGKDPTRGDRRGRAPLENGQSVVGFADPERGRAARRAGDFARKS